MCESLDSASAELAIDLAIERQRRQIQSEVARARVGRAASRIPQIYMQRLVNVREALANVAAAGEDELHTGSDQLAKTVAGQDERPNGEAEQRWQIVAAEVSFDGAF
jgi:hypothetical protein